VARYRAVLFDWMLTLAHYPDPVEHVSRAFGAIGQVPESEQVVEVVARLAEAGRDPDVVAAKRDLDCSLDLHRRAEMLHFERAHIEPTLAEAMYGLLGDPTFHPLYPGVVDVLSRLSALGVRVAVISDIHVDLREHATLNGIDGFIDAWVLSFERGCQKPDAALFEAALSELDVEAREALMVGDRPARDGAAALLGIDTLILPPRAAAVAGRLDAVLRLVK
jgi:FMN phosphatase YigB (HAD superfamily)